MIDLRPSRRSIDDLLASVERSTVWQSFVSDSPRFRLSLADLNKAISAAISLGTPTGATLYLVAVGFGVLAQLPVGLLGSMACTISAWTLGHVALLFVSKGPTTPSSDPSPSP